MKKLRAVLRWTGRILLVLLAILVIFILEENIRGRIMLARYKAELRAKGEKLTLEEFNLPKPPREGNGAPALLLAADELSALSNRNPLQTFGLGLMKFVGPGRAVVWHRQEQLPDLRVRQAAFGRGGRRSRLKADGEVTQERPSSPPPTPPTRPWTDLSIEIANAQPALARAEHTLQQPMLSVDLNYGEGSEMMLPHLNKTRSLGSWWGAAALVSLHDGDYVKTAENITDITALTRFSKQERILVSQLTRMNIGEIGLAVTWEALQADGWTEPELARLQTAWGSAEVLPQVLETIEVERALMAQEFDKGTRWPRLKDLREGTWYDTDMSLWGNIRTTAQGIAWRSAWVAQDRLRLTQRWQRDIEIAREALANRSWPAARTRLEQVQNEDRLRGWSFYDSWRYALSGALGAESAVGSLRRFLQFETQRQLTIAAIALRRYKLRHGHPSPTLDALVPDLLSRPPLDYMDGKQLRYRPGNDGNFVLYSVGEDGIDDGGDPTPRTPSHAPGLWYGRDAVWPQAASER